MVVALTSRHLAGAMAEHFAGYGIDDVETRIVAHTDTQLEAIATALQRRLAASRGSQEAPGVEVGRGALGKVTVAFVNGAANAVERDVLAQARSNHDVFVVSEVDRIEVGVKDACDRSDNIECDPPLRGSVWIQNNSTGGVCSAGFNTRSKSDNKPYVLTAGHLSRRIVGHLEDAVRRRVESRHWPVP